jgi:hypothetical protein
MSNGIIVASDMVVQKQSLYLEMLLNAGCWMALYQQPVNPTPSTTLASFTAVEANYGGYARLDITGEWQTPQQTQPGDWVVAGLPHPWLITGQPGNRLFGAFFLDKGNPQGLLFSYEFIHSILLIPGVTGPTLQPFFHEKAQSLGV